MVTRQGWVKLCDLGLARFAMDLGEEEVTGTGQAMGTPDYMAPEQITDSRRVDIRADIYSLGCTFYKLLTGWAPFTGPEYRTAVQKMMAHTDKAPPPIGLVRKDVHPDLIAVIERMMAKDPNRRYATPAELVATLQPFTVGANLIALFQRAELMSQSPQGSGPQPSLPVSQQPASAAGTKVTGFGMRKLKSLLQHYKTPILVFLGALIGVLLANLLAIVLFQPGDGVVLPPSSGGSQQASESAPAEPAAPKSETPAEGDAGVTASNAQ
jgi:serine/threonine protein kinase